MITKRRHKRRTVQTTVRHLTSIEFKAIALISTLLLAGVISVEGIRDPVVWTFLGTAMGLSLGQTAQITKGNEKS
jgi:hypothetical protein